MMKSVGRKLSLFALAASLAATAHASGIGASAVLSGFQASPGVYDYSIGLSNTGSTNIGTFWFSWVPGAGFMSSPASGVGSPAGWTSKLTNGGDAIQWTTATSPLLSGGSLTGFTFVSAETPDQLLGNFGGTGTGAGDPVLTSFVYIGAPLKDPGAQFLVTEAPEPGTLALGFTGIAAAGIFALRRRGFQTA